jgi:putative membrane protein
MHWYGGGFMGMGLMWVFWVVVVALIAYLIIRAAGSSGSGTGGGGDSPEAILKRRYAKGEINKEQYEQMLQDLRR